MVPGSQRFGIVGFPIAHSASPALYNRLFRDYGLRATYEPCELPPAYSPYLIRVFQIAGFTGINLTAPFKTRVLDQLSELSPDAVQAGAVNTVLFQGGKAIGHNTDKEGFICAIRQKLTLQIQGLRVGILGAGGAARAVAAGLADHHASAITLLNRSPHRAKAVCDHLRTQFAGVSFFHTALNASQFAAVAPNLDLVVNCTTASANPVIATLSVAPLPSHAVWCDINYWVADPPQVKAVTHRGLQCLDGQAMFVHQAVRCFELFSGIPTEPVRVEACLG